MRGTLFHSRVRMPARSLAAVLAVFYAWACWSPALTPVASLLAALTARPACSAAGPHEPCQCLLDRGMGGHCCCKHAHDATGAPEADSQAPSGASGEDCAK